ncbi:MAG: ABC transporter ATP-binding protein [Deltaproteobacteria bacterium]|nr:ABC transporter ATP-binding protein [Deltaproteobacteria bacterium]
MIDVRRVSKRFAGRGGRAVAALVDVDLRVQAGELVMVTGPSGSGKSTLLFTLGAMLKPTSGEVFLGDTSLYRVSPGRRAELRRTRLAFVFQTFNLIPYLTCLANVALAASLAGRARAASLDRARTLLGRLGLGARLHHRPAELSVGERQRAALCRSLVNDPEVLLADEPTGNLDEPMTDEVMRLLADLRDGGLTIVMATHNLRVARLGTRVVALREGRVADDWPSVLPQAAA